MKAYAEKQLMELYERFAGYELPLRNELMYHIRKIIGLAEAVDKKAGITTENMVNIQMEYRKPKKPIVTLTQYFGIPSLTVVSCPTCIRTLEANRSENKDKFCPSCGQAIDWTDVQI